MDNHLTLSQFDSSFLFEEDSNTQLNPLLLDQQNNIPQNLTLKKYASIDLVQEYQEKCKNHSNKPAFYYTSEEPWIKFCSKCALNLALCGKKIEKRLTEEQLKKKFELETITYQLKYNIKMGQAKEESLQRKITHLQLQYIKPIQSLFNLYDTTIDAWTKKRDELYNLYSEQILQYFNSLNQLKNIIQFTSLSFKAELKNIQSNLALIIHDLSYSDFTISMSTYKNTINSMLNKIKSNDHEFQFDLKKVTYDELSKTIFTKSNEFKLRSLEILKSENSGFCINSSSIQSKTLTKMSDITILSDKQTISKQSTNANTVNQNLQKQNKQEITSQKVQQIKLKIKPLQSHNSQQLLSSKKKELRIRGNSKLSEKKQPKSKSPILFTPKPVQKSNILQKNY